MPLSGEAGCISGALRGFGQGELPQRQSIQVGGWQQRGVPVPFLGLVPVACLAPIRDAGGERVLAHQQRSPAGLQTAAAEARVNRIPSLARASMWRVS